MSTLTVALIAPLFAMLALQEGGQADYVNAGILPYSTESGEVRLLLGFDGENAHWSDFVGVCTPGETPAATAAREFAEETRGAYAQADMSRRLQGVSPVPVGPTRIFLLDVPEVSAEQIARLTKSRNSEKTSYCWVRLLDLLESVDSGGPRRAEVPASCGGDNAKVFNLLARSLQQGQELRRRLLAPDPGQSATTLDPAERCGR
jgi:hypothetical protein